MSAIAIGLRKPHCFLLATALLSTFALYGQKKITADSAATLRHLEQTDLIDFAGVLLRPGKSKATRSGETGTVHFSTIPLAPSHTGNGSVTVSAINASFYLGKKTNISSIYFYPYTNFTTSYGIWLTPNIWFDKNEWNGTGDFRILHNAMNDYGMGGSLDKSERTQVNYSQLRTYAVAHTRVYKALYLGGGFAIDRFFAIGEEDPDPATASDFRNYGTGTTGDITSAGVTANALHDDRKNSVNPSQGFYMAMVVRANRPGFGSTYSWSSFFLDARKYHSFSNKRHKVLAGRAFYWGTFGDVPYLNLPSTFQDPSGRAGRGYSTDRFRGHHMLFAEAEYRFDITQHGFLGGTFFANVQSYSDNNKNFSYIRPAAGFGLRLKFNRNSDTNLTIDFALGQEGLFWYVSLGEYF